MSKETKNVEYFKKLSDQIWLHDLDEQFQKVHEELKKAENDPVISAEVLFNTYYLMGYQRGIESIHRLVSSEMEVLGRMISLDEALGAEA